MLIRNLLLSAALILSSSCALFKAQPVQETVTDSRPAVTHLMYEGASCSAFHIGNGLFITAAHCFGSDLDYEMKEIRMIDQYNFQYFPKVAKYNQEKDLVLLSAPDFKGPALQLWDSFFDGKITPGMEMVTFGFPGYYWLGFQFEPCYVKDVTTFQGVEVVVSEEGSYSGESGGPTVSAVNGKVIGMVDAGIERIQWYESTSHSHVSISLFVSANEIRAFLAE